MTHLLALGFTVVAIVVALVIEALNGRRNNAGTVAMISGILTLIVNYVLVWGINIPFDSLMSGYAALFFASLVIPTIVSGVIAIDNGSGNGATAGVIVILIALVVTSITSATSTPAWCNDEGLKAQISLLDLQPAPAGMTFHPTSLDQLIKVPQSAALTKAGNELSGGENVALGNYLQPAVAYLTHVQGVPTYIIDLKVTNAMGYRNAAASGQEPAIPGYLLVNAIDSTAPAELRLGYRIVYAPEALFSYDLDRKVYFNYNLPEGMLISDLDGMEVSDDLAPSYTGTVMSHPLSYKTTQPVGIYKLDPTTGQGEFIPMADIATKLPHLDRVYPLDWVLEQVTLWGQFANHQSCTLNTNGQVQIDSYNEVVTPNGIEYQITMTGMGDDPSMTQLITVDAQTGKGYIFPLTGKSVESIKDQFKGLTKQLRIDGLNVDECELHAIDGVNTVYCIFTNADQYGNTNISGYGFVAIDRAENDANYALADTFDGAYNEYLDIRSSAEGNTVIANTANDVTIIGTVMSNEIVATDDNAFTRLINVKGDDGLDYWFMADGSSKNAAAATVGRHVTVTGYQREGQQFMTVRYITSDGVPDFGGKISAGAKEVLDYLKSWLP